ncbi:hypothetical protein J2Z42_002149 [Clostridium algifaecis]|uniref:Uncharacterized protein n=1 Tax=Clostridium algifaecis TaxID=1472040 RepID=A0ABS4KVD1_9CLOT|nr:hypothetical protein [Clostridium algifaecis]MBP2033446.1 hypothetical protein [Clostridium algifaecis]
MSYLNSADPDELAVISTFVAIVLSKNKTSDQINVLGNLIVSIGGIMLTIAAQKQHLESIQDKETQIHDLKKQIKDLKND